MQERDTFIHYEMPSKKTNPVRQIDENSIAAVSEKRLNDYQYVNKYLESLNRSLDLGQRIEVYFETLESRRERILKKFPLVISRPYYFLDFIVKRVFPKWGPTRKIYFWLTKGNNRVMSIAETLGRLYSCGFCVESIYNKGYLTYVVAKKNGDPKYDMNPTFGIIINLKRLGINGKIINVYKFRTMHPYAEYIQQYIYENNKLSDGGKFFNDYRVTSWGRFMRALWIDEIPMIYNWIKGDLKLVGVRPLSQHYFSLYPSDFKAMRLKVKPGLIPPFYADLPNTLDEIIESEKKYIIAYQKKPISTDIYYFLMAFKNILLKRSRSN